MEKWKKNSDLIKVSSEIMVTMVELFTVPSGTTVKMVVLVTVTIRNNGNKGMQSHGTIIPTATMVGFITVQSGEW